MKDLHYLSRFQDRLSYLYLDKCRIDRYESAVAAETELWRTPIPVCDLALLLLGPGTTVTHEAVKILADSNCTVAWTGDEGVRMYAVGLGGTHSSLRLLKQADCWADPHRRLDVVRRMYEMRFNEPLPPELDINQVRGREGNRVRACYRELAERFGVPWQRRQYEPGTWSAADPINRAVSAANSCLYGVTHAAIVSTGLSAGIGFIHTGKMLSFVYDIADIFKTEVSLPAAFQAVAQSHAGDTVERSARTSCRDAFRAGNMLPKLVGAALGVIYGDDDPGEDPGTGEGRIIPVVGRGPDGLFRWEDQRTGTQ